MGERIMVWGLFLSSFTRHLAHIFERVCVCGRAGGWVVWCLRTKWNVLLTPIHHMFPSNYLSPHTCIQYSVIPYPVYYSQMCHSINIVQLCTPLITHELRSNEYHRYFIRDWFKCACLNEITFPSKQQRIISI